MFYLKYMSAPLVLLRAERLRYVLEALLVRYHTSDISHDLDTPK